MKEITYFDHLKLNVQNESTIGIYLISLNNRYIVNPISSNEDMQTILFTEYEMNIFMEKHNGDLIPNKFGNTYLC